MGFLLIQLLVFVAIGVIAIGVVRRQRKKLASVVPDGALRAGADGAMVIPIMAAIIRGGLFGGMARNSINPTLALTPEGLAFKVLRQDRWTYAQLTGVHASKGLLGPTIDFKSARANLNVTVRDIAAARQVLAALPPTVPLSAKAVALRDDTAA